MTEGKLPENKGKLINFLGKDAKRRKAVSGTGKRAELSYEVIRSNDRYSLLKIKPATGKFHQIRAQLSLAGFPILGDVKYGAKFSLPDKSIALSATSISFQLATKKEIKKISIQMPAWWDKYIKLN